MGKQKKSTNMSVESSSKMDMNTLDPWYDFKGSDWKDKIDVYDFIQKNYEPYDGDDSFLEGTTESTDKLW